MFEEYVDVDIDAQETGTLEDDNIIEVVSGTTAEEKYVNDEVEEVNGKFQGKMF